MTTLVDRCKSGIASVLRFRRVGACVAALLVGLAGNDARATETLSSQPAVLPVATAQTTAPASLPREVKSVIHIRLEDHSVNPITTRFILQNLEKAEKAGSALLLEMDTPGGLLSSTREIVKAFLAARTPVMVYVSPNGSRAASAGVFITVSSHVAVMAPSTHMGAATPISLDGSGDKPKKRRRATETTGTQTADGSSTQPGTIRIVFESEDKDGEENSGTEGAAAAKALNDTVAWAEATAKARNRNPAWVRETVLDARSSTADEVLKLGVIDFIATSTADLYRLADGRVVQTANGPAVLRTASLSVGEPVVLSFQERFLNFLADGQIALLLISLGSICIAIEIYSGGTVVASVIAFISFALAAIALNILPINTLALVMIVLGFALIVIELKFPLYLIPTFGGVAFLVIGALMLIDEPRILPGGAHVPVGVAVGLGSGTGGILAILVALTLRVHRRKVLTGATSFEGEIAEVSEELSPQGMVSFAGTYWSATLVDDQGRVLSGQTVAKGRSVRVRKVINLRVEVTALPESSTP